jgi:hypothetical protein
MTVTPRLYRHKPNVVEAVEVTDANKADIVEWADGNAYIDDNGDLIVCTGDGDHICPVGHRVIRGVTDWYFNRPDTFAASYDPVGEGDQ